MSEKIEITNKIDFVGKIDQVLSENPSKPNYDISARIFLEIGLLLLDELDFTQQYALTVAQNYLDDKSKFGSQRDAYFSVLGDRLNFHISQGRDETKEAALNRIVWCSLHEKSRLEPLLIEFVIYLSAQVGLENNKLDKIFSKHIPEYDQL